MFQLGSCSCLSRGTCIGSRAMLQHIAPIAERGLSTSECADRNLTGRSAGYALSSVSELSTLIYLPEVIAGAARTL